MMIDVVASGALHLEDLPRCTRCGTPVEWLGLDVDAMTGEVIIEARCHGASRVVRIPRSVWDNLLPETFEFGPAF